MDGEIIEIGEDQISFRKRRKKGDNKDNIFARPGYIHREPLEEDPKEKKDNE